MLKCRWLLQVTSGSLSLFLSLSVSLSVSLSLSLSLSRARGANRGLTPARTCEDRRKLFVPAVAGRKMLGVPYIKRAWCCHSDMLFWLGFATLALGSVKNIYRKAVVYNSAWQGRQTPWGIPIPEVLQYLYTLLCVVINNSYLSTTYAVFVTDLS